MNLDMGDWPQEMAEAADFLRKRDCTIDAAKLQILSPEQPDFIRNFWIIKAAKDFPKLAFAANKLQSAHTTTAAAERNWSAWGRTYTSLHANFSLETAEKAVYVKAKMPEKWYS